MDYLAGQKNLTLIPVTEEVAETIWRRGKSDRNWPFLNRSWEGFRHWIQQYDALSALSLGEMRIIDELDPLGFVLINRIDETWLPHGLSAVECGTYLLPQYRGQGFNLPVKEALCTRTVEQFQADWAVFVVSNSNVRAKRAMDKLPWLVEVVTNDKSGPFARYLHRKIWETGQPSELYAFPLPLRPTSSNNL